MTTSPPDPDTDQLVEQASQGDATAVDELLSRHRQRLRRMVWVRMDPRLAQRFDPSDVVQDTLAEAHRRLNDYVRDRPMPFYPWLRQIAWNRLVDLYRRHVKSGRRSVTRETPLSLGLSDRSTHQLIQSLAAKSAGPRDQLLRSELQERMRQALDELAEADREILILRHLEQLSIAEVSAVLGVPEGTVKSRHFRALERLRRRLSDEVNEL